MEKNWLYYGVFFSENTKRALLNYTKKHVNVPDDWKVYCDHMTIIYNDGNANKERVANHLEMFLGVYASLRITHIGVSDRAIALKVDFHSQNKHSHITIAVAPNAKPVESNYINNWIPVSESFYVTGKYNKVTK